ncbi:MAG: DMT family transporter [Anaerolineae bacterium]|nr:DMT family transporter [Anaerolineae bacterium]
MNRQFAGMLLILVAAIGYALFPIFAKLAYADGLTATSLLAWRFLVATGATWLLAPAWWKAARLAQVGRRHLLRLGVLGALFAVLALAALFALERIPASTYIIMLYTYPAMVAILSMFLGERLAPVGWGAIIMAIGGCALVVGAKFELNSPLDLALPLINALTYAVYLVLVDRIVPRGTSGIASGVLSVSGSALAILPLIAVMGLPAPATGAGWGAVAGIALISTTIPIMSVFGGIAILGATRAAIVNTIEPVISVAFAALLLGESVGWAQIAGGALILTSVVVLQLAPPTHHRSAHPRERADQNS